MIVKTIIYEVPLEPSEYYRTPRIDDIQECIDTANREGTKVELQWHIYDETPATYVMPAMTIEEVQRKIDTDTLCAAKAHFKREFNIK